MKENNLNRVIGWSGLLLTSLLSTSALADNIGTSAEELGLSDYRHFVIYPRLDKALKAQKNNDEATAIREFEYIHQQVPDNIPGNDSNLLIVFYVQIMPDDFVMQLHR
ncbi:hypothetical protein P4I42_22635, partial [Escherichia coli]